MKDFWRKITLTTLVASLLIVPLFIEWRRAVPIIQVIEAEGFFLGIFCLFFALRQFRDAKEHTLVLRENTSTLAEVKEHLSTKFLAVFPYNIPELKKFISGMSHDFDIMIDFAGYGQYSVPEQFASYFAALEECARHSTIRMLAYGAGIAKGAIREQWPDSLFQKELKEPKESRLLRFLNNHQDLVPSSLSSEEFLQQLTYDQFIEMQLQVQMQSLSQLTKIRNITIRTIDDVELLLIAWIRSDDHAVFSFKNRGSTLRELAFSTKDTALVPVFRSMFERLWSENDPVNKSIPKVLKNTASQPPGA
jgi:hypothetical protein